MLHTGGKVLEPLFAALARDERCFYMLNAAELWEKMKLQVHVEQQYHGAIGPNIPVKDVINHYKVSLLDTKS